MPPQRLSGDVRRLVLGNTLSALGTGFTLPFLLIYLTHVRGFSVTTAGYAIATLGLVGLLSVPLAGALSDRIGPWRVLVMALALTSAGTAGLAAVHRPWHAFVVISVVAVGQAASWPAQSALIAALVPSAQRPRVFAVQFALLNLGIGIGGAVSGLFVDVHHARTFEVIYLVDSLSYVAYAVILGTIRHVAAPRSASPGEASGGGYREVFADRRFLRLGGVVLLLSLAGYGQVNAGFPAFVSDVAHVSTRTIGFAFAANTAVIVAAQLLVERRLQGRRRTHALAGVALIWAVSWLVIGSAALAGGRLLPAVAVVAGLGLFGLGETLWAPTGQTLVNDIAPPHLRGRYNALSSLTWQMSSILGPIVAGVLLGAHLPGVFIAVLTAILVTVALLAVRLQRYLTPAQNGIAPPEPPSAAAFAADASAGPPVAPPPPRAPPAADSAPTGSPPAGDSLLAGDPAPTPGSAPPGGSAGTAPAARGRAAGSETGAGSPTAATRSRAP